MKDPSREFIRWFGNKVPNKVQSPLGLILVSPVNETGRRKLVD